MSKMVAKYSMYVLLCGLMPYKVGAGEKRVKESKPVSSSKPLTAEQTPSACQGIRVPSRVLRPFLPAIKAQRTPSAPDVNYDGKTGSFNAALFVVLAQAHKEFGTYTSWQCRTKAAAVCLKDFFSEKILQNIADYDVHDSLGFYAVASLISENCLSSVVAGPDFLEDVGIRSVNKLHRELSKITQKVSPLIAGDATYSSWCFVTQCTERTELNDKLFLPRIVVALPKHRWRDMMTLTISSEPPAPCDPSLPTRAIVGSYRMFGVLQRDRNSGGIFQPYWCLSDRIWRTNKQDVRSKGPIGIKEVAFSEATNNKALLFVYYLASQRSWYDGYELRGDICG